MDGRWSRSCGSGIGGPIGSPASFKTGVLIHNWVEDTAGGNILGGIGTPASFTTTHRNSYHDGKEPGSPGRTTLDPGSPGKLNGGGTSLITAGLPLPSSPKSNYGHSLTGKLTRLDKGVDKTPAAAAATKET